MRQTDSERSENLARTIAKVGWGFVGGLGLVAALLAYQKFQREAPQPQSYSYAGSGEPIKIERPETIGPYRKLVVNHPVGDGGYRPYVRIDDNGHVIASVGMPDLEKPLERRLHVREGRSIDDALIAPNEAVVLADGDGHYIVTYLGRQGNTLRFSDGTVEVPAQLSGNKAVLGIGNRPKYAAFVAPNGRIAMDQNGDGKVAGAQVISLK